MKLFKELYQYREFLKSNIKKDIRGKYKGSFLGVLWSFINPLLSVLIYAIIFPFIMRSKMDNYLIYLITGVIPWTFFVLAINNGMMSIIQNGNIIKKVYFPRIILPISAVTSGVVNFLISCGIIMIFILFSGMGFSWNILFLPLIMIVQYILLIGIVLIISSVNLYVRDVEHIFGFFINMLFYATPILYSPSFIPEKFAFIFNLNPMKHIIGAYRDIFYYQTSPNFVSLGIVLLCSLALVFIGYAIFQKLEKGFAEEV